MAARFSQASMQKVDVEDGEFSSVGESLPSMPEALNSMPSTAGGERSHQLGDQRVNEWRE